MDIFSAYGVSFVMYGTYGWIDEWLHRGMQEDSEVIAQVLSAGQNKASQNCLACLIDLMFIHFFFKDIHHNLLQGCFLLFRKWSFFLAIT